MKWVYLLLFWSAVLALAYVLNNQGGGIPHGGVIGSQVGP